MSQSSPYPTNPPPSHAHPHSLTNLPTQSLTSPHHRNKKETLSQNYTRFGLVAKLGKATGGAAPTNRSTLSTNTDPLAAAAADRAHGLLRVGEVRVERDADGRITRVVRDENPLGDPLNDLDSDEDEGGDEGGEAGLQLQREQAQAQARARQRGYEEWSGFGGGDEEDGDRPEVLRALEREANRPTEKTVRHQSERELDWLKRLADKHGDDTSAMARDVKLNPMQQTAADIRRRLKKAGLLEV